MKKRLTLISAMSIALVAMAVPAGAIAKNDKPNGGGKGQSKAKNYNFKGTYNADGTLLVTKGNSRVRKGGFIGDSVAFDYSSAKFSVTDTNADGVEDINDVQAGDRVMVKARLPKGDPGTPPFAARKVVSQDDSAEDEPEATLPVL
ncbi:MAG: hypothetical protein H0U42_09055 [Thermoleophilaceae bacterium]|nr:hypothetical protein [Thermoleophilaceae bacterium]